MTTIKFPMSMKFGQIGPMTAELAALERLKKSYRLTMGKYCDHSFLSRTSSFLQETRIQLYA